MASTISKPEAPIFLSTIFKDKIRQIRRQSAQNKLLRKKKAQTISLKKIQMLQFLPFIPRNHLPVLLKRARLCNKIQDMRTINPICDILRLAESSIFNIPPFKQDCPVSFFSHFSSRLLQIRKIKNKFWQTIQGRNNKIGQNMY